MAEFNEIAIRSSFHGNNTFGQRLFHTTLDARTKFRFARLKFAANFVACYRNMYSNQGFSFSFLNLSIFGI